jgi:chromosomal replication initiation ATPase DnaA
MFHASNFTDDLRALAPVDVVITLTARYKRIPVRMFTHPSRGRANAALARQLAMYLVHVTLGETLSRVGEAFGRDRTTVSHACGLIEDMRDDPAFDAELTELERNIEALCGARHG